MDFLQIHAAWKKLVDNSGVVKAFQKDIDVHDLNLLYSMSLAYPGLPYPILFLAHSCGSNMIFGKIDDYRSFVIPGEIFMLWDGKEYRQVELEEALACLDSDNEFYRLTRNYDYARINKELTTYESNT